MTASDKIRVLHLIKGLGRGGAETLLSQGLSCADTDNFEFAYAYFLPFKNQLVGEIESQGCQVTCLGGSGSAAILAKVPAVAGLIRRWRADVVHCHLPLAGVVGRASAKIAGCRVVYTEHNVLERYNAWTRRLHLSTWRMLDHVIAVSREVADSIHRHAGDRVPVQTVQNGVAVARFAGFSSDRNIRAELGISPQSFVVGTCAVFRTQKRLDLWLQAAAAVAARVPDSHFILVGDGPLRGELEELRQALNLGRRVHFVGLQEDVRPYLASFDAFLMSSIFEGLPVAMLEAMASECAVVTTRVGGIPEVIDDRTHGRVVEPGRVDLLVAALVELAADRDLRERFGQAARQRVESSFSMTRMSRELEATYRGLAR